MGLILGMVLLAFTKADWALDTFQMSSIGFTLTSVFYVVLVLLAWSVVLPNVSVILGSFERGLDDWRAFVASPADRDAIRDG